MNNTKRLQNEILNIFFEFDRICKKYNLRYYAIGGTCLGAVRHNGFIPWDDDMDVAMPWEDYNLFISVCKDELIEPFELLNFVNSDNVMKRKYCKLINYNTTFVEKRISNNYDYYSGIFLDIMPIVGCPKNKFKEIKFIKSLRLYDILNDITFIKFRDVDGLKSKLIWLFFKPYTLTKSKSYFSEKWISLVSSYKFNEGNNVLFPWRIPLVGSYKNVFDYSIFSNNVYLNFENVKISCPIFYKKYLEEDFGDYMKLPPIEKQVTHDPYILDFDKSYKSYIER